MNVLLSKCRLWQAYAGWCLKLVERRTMMMLLTFCGIRYHLALGASTCDDSQMSCSSEVPL